MEPPASPASAAPTGAVYFYCHPPGPPDNAVYQHELVCLAEGLRQLGVPVFANLDYWRRSARDPQYLLPHDPAVGPDDCRIVVLSHHWLLRGRPLPERLFHPGRAYCTVYVDLRDGPDDFLGGPPFDRFDLILRAQMNGAKTYPANVRAWAFGLSERMLAATEPIGPFAERRRVLLVNHRHEHPVRHAARRRILPALGRVLPLDDTVTPLDDAPAGAEERLQWAQTGRRHHPAYYERLRLSAGCACFGGYFLSPPLPEGAGWRERALARWRAVCGRDAPGVAQWDSWRFWEALSAGCVAFHLDFERYGMRAPVPPQNWTHYVGIDLRRVGEAVERLRDDPALLPRISAAGRAWAREHYGPAALARRLLAAVAG